MRRTFMTVSDKIAPKSTIRLSYKVKGMQFFSLKALGQFYGIKPAAACEWASRGYDNDRNIIRTIREIIE
jgi:hypothetical protein